MFYNSCFNGNINQWDVSNVESMKAMFKNSSFNKNLNDWKPLKIKNNQIFENSILKQNNKIPYWGLVEPDFIQQAINAYHLNKKMSHDLPIKVNKKMKNLKV